MDDEGVHPLTKTPTSSLSATCDEILSWMTKIWMEIHLVSESTCNIVNLLSPETFHNERQMMLG